MTDDKKDILGKRELSHLGWLGTSGVLPSKRQEIEGVTSASIIGLQTQLYRTQEHNRLRRDGIVQDRHLCTTPGFVGRLSAKNAGVEARNLKDLAAHKAATDKASQCHAALERKAQLYDRLVQGLSYDDEEKYEVDFLRKRDAGEAPPVSSRRGYGSTSRSDDDDGEGNDDRKCKKEESKRDLGSKGELDTYSLAMSGSGDLCSADMARDRSRRAWEDERLEEERDSERRRLAKEVIREVAEETREERARAEEAKRAKEQQVGEKLQRLKADFLKKQLQAARQAKQTRKGPEKEKG